MINFTIKQSIEDYPTDFRLMIAEAISWLYVHTSENVNEDGHYPIKSSGILLGVLDADGNINYYNEVYVSTPEKVYDCVIRHYQHHKTYQKVFPSIKLDESDKHRLLTEALSDVSHISARYEGVKQLIKEKK